MLTSVRHVLICSLPVLTHLFPWSSFLHTLRQGVKLTFFSDSHLAPKFFKVVANSPSWSPFSKTNKIFLYAVSVLDRPSKIELGKRSLTCYKVDTRMVIYNVQAHLNPRWRLVIDRDACATFWKQT